MALFLFASAALRSVNALNDCQQIYNVPDCREAEACKVNFCYDTSQVVGEGNYFCVDKSFECDESKYLRGEAHEALVVDMPDAGPPTADAIEVEDIQTEAPQDVLTTAEPEYLEVTEEDIESPETFPAPEEEDQQGPQIAVPLILAGDRNSLITGANLDEEGSCCCAHLRPELDALKSRLSALQDAAGAI